MAEARLPSDVLKSPLEEFCEKKLKEFGDIDERTRQSATETVQKVCDSPDSDKSDESFVNIKSPTVSPDSSSSHSTNTCSQYGTEYLLSDSDWKEPVTRTLEFLQSDLENTPPEEQPSKFMAFLENRRKRDAESSLSDMVKRFRDFMMLTTAKEYIIRKWRNLKKEASKQPSMEKADEDTEISSESEVAE